MNLILVTAFLAVCGADKLDRTYLPPASATTAGGTPGSLQTPFKTFNQGLGGLPTGGYSNEFEGVVVDAAAPGTRASGADGTGLGGPRVSYGSTDSKVGEAAFTADTAFPRVSINSGPSSQGTLGVFNNFSQNPESRPERVQSARDRVSNTVKYENDVSPDKFNYAFETDNGISAAENGIEVDGVKAQGGYSYTGDDGQVYSVTYTADEDGYRPKGDHLPTPPPIPVEILKSLEKNAQDEAAGVIDDGSYDAQKYNTGDDYTNGNIGQYNSRPLTQVGNRPQSDAEASGSFISQNNQGFIRPNSYQITSTSLLDSSKNVPTNGNNFGVSNAAGPTQATQSFGFGAAEKNEYLPPNNAFTHNRRPTSNGFQGLPVSSATSNSNINKNQNIKVPTFIPLAQQKLQEDRPKRPLNNSPIFGKPTIIDSTLSIKDPFAKRPSGNRFTQSKQPNQKPQAIGGSFEVVSGNVYSSKNEYLPPRRQNNTPNQTNGNQRFQGINSGTQINQQTTGSQFLGPNSPSASAFASVSRPTSEFHSQQFNSQQIPQYAGNNLLNPIRQNPSSNPSNNVQLSPSTGISSFNKSPVSQFQNRPGTFASQSPTLKPQSELNTPLASNSALNQDAAPTPIVDGPDSPSLTGFSSLSTLGSQPSNSLLGQNSFNSNKIQQVTPTKPSAFGISTLSDQSNFPSTQIASETLKPIGNLGVQSQSLNNLPVSGQHIFSSPMPSFNYNNQQQGSDDSYYYNTPSKPFNTPTPRPQVPILSSTSFDQTSKVTQTPFGGKPQMSDGTQTLFTPQGNTPAEAASFLNPSTLGPISPTRPTMQNQPNGNKFQSQFNKVTQASTSPFPSPTPTASADYHRNKLSQFETRPKENQGFNQQAPALQSQQQYNGEIYEYNKPPQTLPSPQNGGSSGQFGQIPQFGPSQSISQFSQPQPTGTYKPDSQFESKFTQQTFGQKPQSPQGSQETQAINDNSPAQSQLKPGQFSPQPAKQGQNSQPIQGASKFPPAYNKQGPSCCQQVGYPSQNSQVKEQEGTPQSSNQFRPNQDFTQQGSDQGTKPVQSVSTFAGVGESFGGPRKPPSFDETGYHY